MVFGYYPNGHSLSVAISLQLFRRASVAMANWGRGGEGDISNYVATNRHQNTTIPVVVILKKTAKSKIT